MLTKITSPSANKNKYFTAPPSPRSQAGKQKFTQIVFHETPPPRGRTVRQGGRERGGWVVVVACPLPPPSFLFVHECH